MRRRKRKRRRKRGKGRKCLPYEIGTNYEYKAKKELEKEGYLVIRSAGSHSPFDLIVLGPLKVNFIQIKRCETSKEAERAIKNFKKRMKKLDKLYDIKKMIDKGIDFSIWVWIKRKGWTKYTYLKENV